MDENCDQNLTEELIKLQGQEMDKNELNSLNADTKDKSDSMTVSEVFSTCLYLGLTAFGGPIAHIGMFNQIFIKEKKIISEKGFAELFALCNVIPGPTSSQLLTAIATVKTKSLLGGLISFLCFNMPALIVMIILASIIKNNSSSIASATSEYFFITALIVGIWQGAVALVLQAAISLSKRISKSMVQLGILSISAVIYFLFNHYPTMIILMVFGGFISFYMKESEFLGNKSDVVKVNKNIPFLGIPAFITFIILYFFLFLGDYLTNSTYLKLYLMESFYRIGSLIVGGGHVVIPLILTEFKKSITEKDILNAFSIVSLLPGPMFNIAGYVGAFIDDILGGVLSALAIFTPGMLLLFSILKFINFINDRHNLQFILRGVSSVAIGFIFTSCAILWYDSCVLHNPFNTIIGSLNVIICFTMLEKYKINVVLVLLFASIYSLGISQTFY